MIRLLLLVKTLKLSQVYKNFFRFLYSSEQ